MHINTINQRHVIEFDQGKFDKWCVYVKMEGRPRYAPVDEEYFCFFKNMALKHGAQKVYNDFVIIYNLTTARHDQRVINKIKEISASYHADAEHTELWLSVIYGGMIAEENKANMILKKRIKRLGMHQILIENVEPQTAAKFSLGKKWSELNALMQQRGFGL